MTDRDIIEAGFRDAERELRNAGPTAEDVRRAVAVYRAVAAIRTACRNNDLVPDMPRYRHPGDVRGHAQR